MSSRRNRSSMEDELPSNLMFDILSRLPVKSIIYCKSVCKKWRHYVSDPYFVHLHLSRSPEALMIHQDLSYERPGTLNWVEIHHELVISVKKLHLHRCPPLLSGYLVLQQGSVNGLVCCCQRNDAIYIFNPVLEQYIVIPPPRRRLATISYGFGVSTTGEYKVIRISINLVYRVCEVSVYTLGSGEWRLLKRQNKPYAQKWIQDVDPGVVVGHHVYWLLPDAEIYDFDMDKETFVLFPSPPESNERELRLMLGVLKGRLSRIAWFSLGLEIWVMKEGSWFKEIAIQEVISPEFMWRDRSEPLCLVDGLNGTSVLMVHDGETKKVAACCLNTNSIVNMDLQGDFSSYVLAYRPSFVKLDNFGSERVHVMQEEEEGLAFDAFKGSAENKDMPHELIATADLAGRQDGMSDNDDCGSEKGEIKQDHENVSADLDDEYEAISDLESEMSDEFYDSDDSSEHDDLAVLSTLFWSSSYGGDEEDADDGEDEGNATNDASGNAK